MSFCDDPRLYDQKGAITKLHALIDSLTLAEMNYLLRWIDKKNALPFSEVFCLALRQRFEKKMRNDLVRLLQNEILPTESDQGAGINE